MPRFRGPVLGILPVLLVAPGAQALQFSATPALVRFPGGSFEWIASVSCADAIALQGAAVRFTLDANLDGVPEASDSLALSPADCEGGMLGLRKSFAPGPPSVLRAELRGAAGSTGGTHALLTAGKGSLLSLHRFCARPRNGEPEWIELRSRAAAPLSLGKVRLEGRLLSGTLDPDESLVASADTTEMRLWRPGARLIALSSWSNLRNTSDTIRLSLDGGLMLDSVMYGPGAFQLEGCASLKAEEAAAASGFEIESPAGRWNRRAGPVVVRVRAPPKGRYDLRVYDLDGAEQCAPARGAEGPREFSLSAPDCGRLPDLTGAAVLLLQPRGAPPVRRLLRLRD